MASVFFVSSIQLFMFNYSNNEIYCIQIYYKQKRLNKLKRISVIFMFDEHKTAIQKFRDE